MRQLESKDGVGTYLLAQLFLLLLEVEVLVLGPVLLDCEALVESSP
jgi:hypothetical protein